MGYDEDLPALENIARGAFAIADAINGLLYAFKYGKETGLSVAEAIEVGAKYIGDSLHDAASIVADGMSGIGSADMSSLSESVEHGLIKIAQAVEQTEERT